jgi:hypothetical protein
MTTPKIKREQKEDDAVGLGSLGLNGESYHTSMWKRNYTYGNTEQMYSRRTGAIGAKGQKTGEMFRRNTYVRNM